MRKLWTLILLLLIGAAGLYLLGPRPAVMPPWRPDIQSSGGGAASELNARGVEELSQGRELEALSNFREAAGLEPRNPVVLRNLSIALARSAMSGDLAEGEALDMLGEALEIWPANPEALDGLSTIHYRNGRYADALQYARRLRQVMPDRPDLEEYVAHLNRRVQDEEGMVAESGDNFRLLYSGTRRLQYEGEILAMLQGEMDAMTAALGIFPDQPVDVLLLTDDLGERADPMDPLLQGLYDGRIRLFLGQGIGDRDKLLLTVRHEMVHALLHRAAGELPGWVQEGIAQKVGEDPDPARLREARDYVLRALKEGQDVDMGSLDNSFVQLQADERNLAYASSLLFMDFMTERYGNTFIPTFVWEMSQGTSAFNAVEKITGKGFAEIQAAFNRRLKEGS